MHSRPMEYWPSLNWLISRPGFSTTSSPCLLPVKHPLCSLREEVLLRMDRQFHHACGQGVALRPAHGQTHSLRKIEQTHGESECKITIEQTLRYPSSEQVHYW